MKHRIGVFGSAITATERLGALAEEIGRELARRDCIVITGACSGLPYRAAYAAAAVGADVWGFSPTTDIESQRRFTPDDDLSIYSRLIHVPLDVPFSNNLPASKKYRNVLSTATCDAGIVISGRWGTLNEFTNLVDFGRIVGVLNGSGEIADRLERLVAEIGTEAGARIFFDESPTRLVEQAVDAVDLRKSVA